MSDLYLGPTFVHPAAKLNYTTRTVCNQKFCIDFFDVIQLLFEDFCGYFRKIN